MGGGLLFYVTKDWHISFQGLGVLWPGHYTHQQGCLFPLAGPQEVLQMLKRHNFICWPKWSTPSGLVNTKR